MKKILYTMLVALATTLSFTSCEDVPAPYDIPTGGNTGGGTTVDTEGDGTEAKPFSAADIKSGKAKGNDVYVKGYIVGFVPDKDISEAKFTADGCEATSNVLIAASADETSVDKVVPVQLPFGDVRTAINLKDNPNNLKQEVILGGNIENYFGKPGVKSVVWAKIGDKEVGKKPGTEVVIAGDPKGTGSKEDPFNIAAVNKYIKDGGAADVEVYVKGKVSELVEFKEQYGSINYYISEDGTTNNQFYVYGGLGLGKNKFTKLDELKVGDELIICGKVKNFSGTYEFDYNNYIYSLNGKTEGGSTPDTPSTPELAAGLKLDTTNGLVKFVNDGVAEGEEVKFEVKDMGIEDPEQKGVQVTKVTLPDGTKLTFSADEGEKSKPTYFGKYGAIRIYKNCSINIAGKSKIAKVVFTCDGKTYVGNTTASLAFEGNNITYKNVYTAEQGGGVQFRFKTIAITYAK